MFHTRLKELRESKNLTQKQLAEILNISRSSLSSYEVGTREPDFSMLMQIATFFNVNLDSLLSYNANPTTVSSEYSSINPDLYNDIESLSEESRNELHKYINLLKINEAYDNEKSTCNHNNIYKNGKSSS